MDTQITLRERIHLDRLYHLIGFVL